MSGATAGPVQQPCLFLLFAPGARPDSTQISNALDAASLGHVSHHPGADQHELHDAADWLEMVVDGLTFDILGLTPGQPLARPRPRHGLGVHAEESAGMEAIGVAPGPHLAGSAHSMPVVRTLLRVSAGLARQLDGCLGIQWQPSSGLIASPLFIEMIEAWRDGAAFPALGLVGLVDLPDGGLRSDGLAFFIRQELVLDRALCADRAITARLLARLADQLIENGGLQSSGQVTLEDGRILTLVPGKAVIRVSPG